jgi:hypothetical protein
MHAFLFRMDEHQAHSYFKSQECVHPINEMDTTFIVLALCKSVWLNRQMTEVTISTNFRAKALACSTQRGLSHVT